MKKYFFIFSFMTVFITCCCLIKPAHPYSITINFDDTFLMNIYGEGSIGDYGGGFYLADDELDWLGYDIYDDVIHGFNHDVNISLELLNAVNGIDPEWFTLDSFNDFNIYLNNYSGPGPLQFNGVEYDMNYFFFDANFVLSGAYYLLFPNGINLSMTCSVQPYDDDALYSFDFFNGWYSYTFDGSAVDFNIDYGNPAEQTADPVPEPATLLLLTTGLLGIIGIRKKISIERF